jgi:cysteinyl-tRNA synthetase
VTIPLRVHNTLGRRVEELRPLQPGRVSIYSCGPTVYRYAHVGNLRTYIFSDLLRRTLGYLGYQTRQVMNITDVGHLTEDDFDRGEDKMLVSARLENKSPEEIAEFYTAVFLEDIRKVNILPADEYPRATTYIPEMQAIIARLIERARAGLEALRA